MTPGRWREFTFLLNQVQRTIELGTPPFQNVLTEWHMIARALSEPKRTRRPQMEQYHQKPGPNTHIQTR